MKRFVSVWFAIVLGSLLTASCSKAQFPAAPGTGPGLPETIEAIDSARVTTRILYITAHPDDESAAVLTYLARGLHADVALLSLTRGEGGQNALGPEQAPQLGLIRTQELLAATRGYGVKLYFTRAKDFGYSKTPEETEKIWGDAVLEDMVRVIRGFRPNIVINGWGGVHSGHGHHQVSGLWTPKAVALAADERSFPELLKEGLPAWGGGSDPTQILDIDRGSDNPKGYVLPLDEVSPLYGKSWRQIGLDAFVNHRTQGISGFINSPFLRRPIAIFREDGKTFDPSTLAVPLTELFGKADGKVCSAHKDWCENLRSADGRLKEARAAALKLDWTASIDLLEQAQKIMDGLRPADSTSSHGPLGRDGEADALLRSDRVFRALLLSAGFQFNAEADRTDVVLKEPFTVTASYRCRPEIKCPVQGPIVVWANSRQFNSTSGSPEKGLSFSVTFDSQPAPFSALQMLDAFLLPSPPRPSLTILILFIDMPSQPRLFIPRPLQLRAYRIPIRVVPAYSLAVQPTQSVEVLNAEHKPFDILPPRPLLFHQARENHRRPRHSRWPPFHRPRSLTFAGVGDQYAKLTVTPPAKLAAGNYTITAYAKRGDEKFSTSLEPLPSMPTILWSEPAQTIVHAFDINVPAKSPRRLHLPPKPSPFPTPSSASASLSICSTPPPSTSAISPDTTPWSSVSAPTNFAPNSPAPTSACSITSPTAERSSSSTIAISSGTNSPSRSLSRKISSSPARLFPASPTKTLTSNSSSPTILSSTIPTKSPSPISITGFRNAASISGAISIPVTLRSSP